MRFVELTALDNAPIIVNIEQVTEIIAIRTGGTRIFYNFRGYDDVECRDVKESYKAIAQFMRHYGGNALPQSVAGW